MSARRLVITKHARSLTVFDGEEEVLRIPVVIGKNPADKLRKGDLATPEGEFYICYKNPASQYHRFLGLSYPNVEDAERGLRDKLITPTECQQIRDSLRKPNSQGARYCDCRKTPGDFELSSREYQMDLRLLRQWPFDQRVVHNR